MKRGQLCIVRFFYLVGRARALSGITLADSSVIRCFRTLVCCFSGAFSCCGVPVGYLSALRQRAWIRRCCGAVSEND